MKKCKLHPQYQGLRRPRSNCPICSVIYYEANPDASNQVNLDIMAGKHKQEIKNWQKKYGALLDQYKAVRDQVSLIEMLQVKCTPIKIKPVREHKSASQAVALMAASDWHVEEEVDSRSVNGKNKFNLDIAEDRATHFFANGLRLTKMFARDVNIDTIVVALLGDFITNYLHEDNNETNNLPPVLALEYAKKLLYSGFKFLLENSDYKIVVPCCYGNHGRITKKKRYANLVGTSMEYALYKWLIDMFPNEERLHFDVAQGIHLYADIFDMKIRFHHGDQIKFNGGVGGLTIPLNKSINQWNKVIPVNLDIIGHWHQSISGRNYLVNGSLIGWNSFAIGLKAEFEEPRQTFALIDRDRGLTFTGPIILSDVQRKIV